VSFIKKLQQAKSLRKGNKQALLEKLEKTPLPFSGWFKEKIEQDIK